MLWTFFKLLQICRLQYVLQEINQGGLARRSRVLVQTEVRWWRRLCRLSMSV